MKWISTKSALLLLRFLRGVSGVSGIEYAMLVAVIVLTSAVAFYHLGDSLKDVFAQIAPKTPVVASNDDMGDAGGNGNTGGDTIVDTGGHMSGITGGNTDSESLRSVAGSSVDSGHSPFNVGWTRGGGSGDIGAGGRTGGRPGSGSHGSTTVGTSGSGASAGDSGGAGGNSGDMSTPAGTFRDRGIGSRLIARADIGHVGSGDISTSGSHGRDNDIGGGGIRPDSIAGDSTSGGDPDGMSAGETASEGYWTRNNNFLWLSVFGLTGLAACLPLLYYIRRRHPEPAVMLLLGCGLVGLARFVRKFKK